MMKGCLGIMQGADGTSAAAAHGCCRAEPCAKAGARHLGGSRAASTSSQHYREGEGLWGHVALFSHCTLRPGWTRT